MESDNDKAVATAVDAVAIHPKVKRAGIDTRGRLFFFIGQILAGPLIQVDAARSHRRLSDRVLLDAAAFLTRPPLPLVRAMMRS